MIVEWCMDQEAISPDVGLDFHIRISVQPKLAWNSLCSTGWPGNYDRSTSVSWVPPGLQKYFITPGYQVLEVTPRWSRDITRLTFLKPVQKTNKQTKKKTPQLSPWGQHNSVIRPSQDVGNDPTVYVYADIHINVYAKYLANKIYQYTHQKIYFHHVKFLLYM